MKDENAKCACQGGTLTRFVQPIILFSLAEAPDHGYDLLQKIARTMLWNDSPPDAAGVYRVLRDMEKRGLIRRERSSEDHRQVHILLTREGELVYAAAHQGLLALPQGLIDRLGAEKMSMFADLMHTVAENFQEMLTERNQTEQEKEDSQKIISF